MEDKRYTISIGSSSFMTLLAIVFIVLKLCKVITWSWVWVLAPIWISWAIAAVIGIIWFIIFLVKR